MSKHGLDAHGVALAAAGTLVLAAAIPGIASADPPYGEDFDAPETFETAVWIEAGGWDVVYQGVFQNWGDVDFYKFPVTQGADVSIKCWLNVATDSQREPCALLLLDPDGIPQATGPGTNSYVPAHDLHSWAMAFDAEPGEWRVQVAGSDLPVPAVYQFQVVVSGGQPAGSVGGGGSPAPAALCAFLAAAGLRLARRFSAGGLGRNSGRQS